MNVRLDDEAKRLEALGTYEILDTLPESVFDDITLLASQICETPVALISFVDADRQWFKSRVGVDILETPRSLAFCDRTIRQNGVFTVNDASTHPLFLENELVTGDPQIRFYSGAVLKSQSGEALGSLCVIDTKPRQLTPRQQESLEALGRQVMHLLESRRLQLEFRKATLITDNIPAHIVYVGSDFRLKFANDFMVRSYGKSQRELYNLHISQLLTPEQYSYRRPIYEQALAGFPQTITVESFNVRGELMITKNVVTPDIDEAGHTKGFVVIAYDQTFEENLKAELLAARIEAEAANAAKSAFLANMSHEIRSPLGAMMGFVELMRDGGISPEEHRQYLDVVSRNAGQVIRLIDEILDLSKVEAGKLEIEDIEFSLEDLLNDFSALMKFRAKENGILFSIVKAEVLPRRICSDPTRIRQILNNVVGNAIKFTHKGQVELEVSLAGNILQFRVKDSGIGISEDSAKRLFEPFHQADASMTRKFGGTGLGLVLTRKLTRVMGGDFNLAHSAPGVGSIFVATLEVKQLLPQSLAKSLRTIRSAENRAALFMQKFLQDKKILIVDDAPDNLLLIKTLLKRWGATVETAEDGSEGVMKANESVYDLVLMDVQMPTMSGHEAMRILRSTAYASPVIALTAHAMADEREKCFESGYTDFLSKPIDREELSAVLKRCLKIL